MTKQIIFFVLALAASSFAMVNPALGQGEFLFELYSTAVLYPEEADQFAASHRSQFDQNFFACAQYLQQNFQRLDHELQESCERWNERNEKRYRQCIKDNYAAGVAGVIADLERLAQGTPWLETASGQQAIMLTGLQQGQYQKEYSAYYPAIATIYGRKTADELMWKYEREVFRMMAEKLEEIRPHFDCVGLSVP